MITIETPKLHIEPFLVWYCTETIVIFHNFIDSSSVLYSVEMKTHTHTHIYPTKNTPTSTPFLSTMKMGQEKTENVFIHSNILLSRSISNFIILNWCFCSVNGAKARKRISFDLISSFYWIYKLYLYTFIYLFMYFYFCLSLFHSCVMFSKHFNMLTEMGKKF